MTKQFTCAVPLVALMIACKPISVEDKLAITLVSYSAPLEIDTFCYNGGCVGEEGLTVEVAFDTDDYVDPTTEVVFQQYRVDYELAELGRSTPYFAAPVNLSVSPDKPREFSLLAAGQAQRTFIYKWMGGNKRVKGTAVLILAGYDNRDEQVIVEKSFDISFGDFSALRDDVDANGSSK